MIRSPAGRAADRLAAGFLMLLMAVGSLVLWIGVPVASLWAASHLTESKEGHFLIALPMSLIGMGLFAVFLVWLNRLYLRTVSVAPEPDDAEEDEVSRVMRGPLEPLLVGSLIIALAALLVWFFVFAENPPRQVI